MQGKTAGICFTLFLLMLWQTSAAQSPLPDTLNQKRMKIEIWSDVLCPFCYIGKRNLEQALEMFEYADKIEVVWKSFLLDPGTIPPKGTDVYNYLAERKGISREESMALHKQVATMAAKSGLNYDFDKAIPANSFDAHRLLQLAKTKGLGTEVKEAVFSAYFTEGLNIGSFPVLISLGEKIGLDAMELMRLFNSDDFGDAVRTDYREAGALNVRGVPFFVFDRKYAVSGAQPAEVLLQYIEKAFDEWNIEE